uniref:Uncharacterized protein n=1 Tax=Romanomermis culicivorax TaxID=13658 RepID=A0A915JR12_ROMCU
MLFLDNVSFSNLRKISSKIVMRSVAVFIFIVALFVNQISAELTADEVAQLAKNIQRDFGRPADEATRFAKKAATSLKPAQEKILRDALKNDTNLKELLELESKVNHTEQFENNLSATYRIMNY